MTFDTHAEAVSHALRQAAQALTEAGLLADVMQMPELARDLTVAATTARGARGAFNRQPDATNNACEAFSLFPKDLS